MIEDLYFKRKTVVNVDAAVVGIGMSRWVSIPVDRATREAAQEIMGENRFDVLPVVSEKGAVSEYFHTCRWNDYMTVKSDSVEYEDVIPLHSSIQSVLKGLATEDRLFYFLTSEHGIAGLISVSNLNCRQVRVFIFSLISELELRLSRLVQAVLSDAQILDESKDEVRESYELDRETGVEADLMEYLYFSDLVNMMAKDRRFEALGYSSRRKFEKDFNPLVGLRNDAAHPPRTLVKREDAVRKLCQRIEVIERSLFHLRRFEYP